MGTIAHLKDPALELLSVTAEMFPFVKTGGLGDVAGSLPIALRSHNIRVTTLIPGYPAVMKAATERTEVCQRDVLGQAVTLWRATVKGLELLIVDAPALFDRPGNPYLGPDGHDWPDNGLRYAVFSRVGASVAQGLVPGYKPDVVQAHDWQAGLVPAYLHYDGQPAAPVLLTLHNLAFQGLFPAENRERFGLPEQAMHVDACEFWGKIGFLKAGLVFAAHLSTVSPTYAEEIQTPELGMGLDGILRARADVLHGILNGIDTEVWNPRADPAVSFPYDVGDIVGRRANKRVFQAEFGLPQDPNAFLLGMVSRLTTQKGCDLLADILPRLMKQHIQLVLVGVGDHQIMERFTQLQARYPHQISCHLRYSETLGHRLHSAVDASLVPSRFEPCGLTQFHALRYGSVPIAARVGGLSDTLVDANTAAVHEGVANGILFSPTNAETLLHAIEHAHKLFHNRAVWGRLQRNGGLHDVSWHGKARTYARLFNLMAGHKPDETGHGDEIAPRLSDTVTNGPRTGLPPIARLPSSERRNTNTPRQTTKRNPPQAAAG